ncbi:FAD-dependent monooxygenase [Pseudonocardia sp. HH130630-07]|uniref:FAD-dependent monooxygenase n=1 Tax=Pseudonocardia sp. HH130630-07 TaxID=1690815 RepID=UPI000814CD71|nr:FAD-dependent monooxygenase [Pseudonocardia sp. HH130630-07]ANY08255.1 FAD-dependent oxidoreductase [Pseudonocardia sp. HH130630-07]
MPRHALISGASIAGPALAHQLHARGWRTTVVERAPRLRDEGQNIDVRGSAREVLRRMGLETEALAAGTGEVGLRFVDGAGAVVAEFPAGTGGTDGATAEMEILRGELSRILYEHTRASTDYRFDQQIRELTEHGDHVTATLHDGEQIEADVVVVAEGTRSRTRGLVFGEVGLDELGMFVAHLTIPRTADDDQWWRWYGASGSRSVGLRPDNRGTTRAMLNHLTDVRGLETLDRADQVTILRRTFADAGWQTRRILDALDDAPMYFDAIAQARLTRWNHGRVVLLGDAAWSAGPFGTGTSLALVGAYVLAGELAGADGDATAKTAAALARYEERMRPYVDWAQDVRPSAIRAMNPRSAAGLAVQRTALRAAAPIMSKLGRITGRASRMPSIMTELPHYPAPLRPVAPA